MYKKNYEGREKITEGFKNGIFPFNYDKVYEERMRSEREEEEEINNFRNKNGLIDYEKLMGKIILKKRDINSELVKKHFFVHDLEDVLKNFKKTKANLERNKIQVSMIKNGNLKKEIENMSKEEEEIEKPNVIVDIVENLLKLIDNNKSKA